MISLRLMIFVYSMLHKTVVMVTWEISDTETNESDTKCNISQYYLPDGLEVVSVRGVMPAGLYLLE